MKKQIKKLEIRKRKLISATQDPDFFRFSYSQLEYHRFPRNSMPEEDYYVLDFGNHKELVVFTDGHYGSNFSWEKFPGIRTLSRALEHTIRISNYHSISLSPEKSRNCTRGIFHRSVSFSVEGSSKNYKLLDKKLTEAGL